MSVSVDPLIGRTLGRYRIVDEISRGGMGVVYRAVDTTLGREVALKVLPPDLVADPDRKRRFINEAKTASQIWFDVGRAYLAAGDETNAAVRFQRVVDSTERIFFPIQFVRRLYFLGHIADRRGDREKGARLLRALRQLLGGRRGRSRSGRGRAKEAERASPVRHPPAWHPHVDTMWRGVA